MLLGSRTQGFNFLLKNCDYMAIQLLWRIVLCCAVFYCKFGCWTLNALITNRLIVLQHPCPLLLGCLTRHSGLSHCNNMQHNPHKSCKVAKMDCSRLKPQSKQHTWGADGLNGFMVRKPTLITSFWYRRRLSCLNHVPYSIFCPFFICSCQYVHGCVISNRLKQHVCISFDPSLCTQSAG